MPQVKRVSLNIYVHLQRITSHWSHVLKDALESTSMFLSTTSGACPTNAQVRGAGVPVLLWMKTEPAERGNLWKRTYTRSCGELMVSNSGCVLSDRETKFSLRIRISSIFSRLFYQHKGQKIGRKNFSSCNSVTVNLPNDFFSNKIISKKYEPCNDMSIRYCKDTIKCPMICAKVRWTQSYQSLLVDLKVEAL